MPFWARAILGVGILLVLLASMLGDFGLLGADYNDRTSGDRLSDFKAKGVNVTNYEPLDDGEEAKRKPFGFLQDIWALIRFMVWCFWFWLKTSEQDSSSTNRRWWP